MRVLVGCEESQTVTKAFREKGLEAYSCDVIDPSGDHPEWHLKKCIFEAIRDDGPWDVLIAFPPCTHLAASAGLGASRLLLAARLALPVHRHGRLRRLWPFRHEQEWQARPPRAAPDSSLERPGGDAAPPEKARLAAENKAMREKLKKS